MLHQSFALGIILRTERIQLWTIVFCLHSSKSEKQMRCGICHERLVFCFANSLHYVRMLLGIFLRTVYPHRYGVFVFCDVCSDIGSVGTSAMMHRARSIDLFTVVGEEYYDGFFILKPIHYRSHHRVIVPCSTVVISNILHLFR